MYMTRTWGQLGQEKRMQRIGLLEGKVNLLWQQLEVEEEWIIHGDYTGPYQYGTVILDIQVFPNQKNISWSFSILENMP